MDIVKELHAMLQSITFTRLTAKQAVLHNYKNKPNPA